MSGEYEMAAKMTERDALVYLLSIVLGEYPNHDERFCVALAIAVKFNIDTRDMV